MSHTATNEFYHDFDNHDFTDAFVESIRQGFENAGLPAFYFVPLSDVSGDSDDEDTDCLIAALPVDRRAIIFKSDYLCAEVRVQPDGIHVGCLLLADGKVPVSERVFYAMELGKRDEINVLWIFTDGHCHLSYRFTDDAAESMAQASRIADALNAPPKHDHAGIFEVVEVRDRPVIVSTRDLTP
jgi:hypothetical protein